jgi:hypothetical protein
MSSLYFRLDVFCLFGAITLEFEVVCMNFHSYPGISMRMSNLYVLETIKFFFRFEPKQTETQSVSIVFQFVSRNQKFFFRFVSVFRTGIETTETNRINLQTRLSIRVSSKQLTFFGSNRNETNLNLFRLFFCFFRETKKNFSLCSGVSDRYIETTETNRTYGMGN